jgi:predicted Zn-dependent protease
VVALKAGNFGHAIHALRMAAADTPAATTDSVHDDAIFSAKLKNTRAQILWLIMVAQRLDGRFTAAEETLQSIGPSLAESPNSILQINDLGEALLAQARDDETRQMIQRMLDKTQ